MTQRKPLKILPSLSVFFLIDISQVQCIKSYQAQEHDELTLEKADILHAKTITSDGKSSEKVLGCLKRVVVSVWWLRPDVFLSGWVEGIRLSDGERGWFPKTYVEEITSRSARLRNLRENIRIKCVTQKLKGADWLLSLETLVRQRCISAFLSFRMIVLTLDRRGGFRVVYRF